MAHPVNPKLIILEGPDGAGKTTLGLMLARYFDGMFFHCTATKSLVTAIKDYQINVMENVEDNIRECGRTVVLDRFWPSEMIYGRVLRPDNINGFSFEEMRERCEALDPMYVICTCDSVIERHRVEFDPEHPYEDSIFAKIVDGYEKFRVANEREPNFMHYDLDKMGTNLKDVAAQIRVRFCAYYMAKHKVDYGR